MNSNRVNGKVDEVLGSIKRRAGGITGNTPLQVKGIAQQVKGKAESTLGKAQDRVRGANQGANQEANDRPTR
jgi:uncharacterized protein YjbJ (UPF0337 family)